MTELPSTYPNGKHQRLLNAARSILIGLTVVAILITVSSLLRAFPGVQSDWQLNNAYASLQDVLSYQTVVALIAVAKGVLLGLYFATAVLLLAQPPTSVTLLAVLTLIALPFSLGLGGLGSTVPQPVRLPES
ncbi:MAG: hypothetical protein R3C44_11625 [Chloroflexota bacterium]